MTGLAETARDVWRYIGRAAIWAATRLEDVEGAYPCRRCGAWAATYLCPCHLEETPVNTHRDPLPARPHVADQAAALLDRMARLKAGADRAQAQRNMRVWTSNSAELVERLEALTGLELVAIVQESVRREALRVLPPGQSPTPCPYCGGLVSGLLATCPKQACRRADIADSVTLDRRIETAES